MEATFGAECFWHVEDAFSKIKGLKIEVGYMGGNEKKYPYPMYEQVCSHDSTENIISYLFFVFILH